MSKNLKKCYQKLKFISQIRNSGLQKKLLKEISNECTYQALREIALNFISGNLDDKKVKKYSKLLKNLTKKNITKTHKRKLVVQSGGFLQYAIPIIGTVLGEILK